LRLAKISVNEFLPQTGEVGLDSADLRDAQLVANTLGITVQEAATQLHLQEVAGNLHAELINNEADTFGESWIEHSPSFKMIIQFTDNGETKIQPYLSKYPELANVIEVRTSKYSYKQLQQMQNQIAADLNTAGVPADTDIDIQKGQIDIFVTDKTNLENGLTEKRLTLPENVNIQSTKRLVEEYSATISSDQIQVTDNPSTLGVTLIGGHKISDSSGSTYGTTGFIVDNSYGR